MRFHGWIYLHVKLSTASTIYHVGSGAYKRSARLRDYFKYRMNVRNIKSDAYIILYVLLYLYAICIHYTLYINDDLGNHTNISYL